MQIEWREVAAAVAVAAAAAAARALAEALARRDLTWHARDLTDTA